MIDAEKKLLQAQHRLEEAQARDRVKERKARTRRLIQDGRAGGPPIFSLRKRNRKKKRGERAMAIYHLEAKVVSRGAGRSAVAASA